MSDFLDSSISDSVTDDAFAQALGDDTPDVSQVADEPASSSETAAVATEADTDEPEATDEPVEETAETEDEEDPKVETPIETKEEAPAADALNWESAPEQFREKYKELKSQLTEAQTNSLKDKFFTSPESFLEELSELSSSQFQHTTQEIVKRGIETQPEAFAEYLAKTQPDAIAKHLRDLSPDTLAQTLFGEGVTAEKAQKIIRQVREQELEDYLDDFPDSEATPKTAEPAKQAEAKADAKPMTEADIDKLVEAKIAATTKPQAVELLKQKTYADIMKPVEDALAAADLAPLPTDSAEEKAFKERVSGIILRETFEHLFSDEKNAPKTKAAVKMIEDLDEKGVQHLASTLKIISEDYAGELIETLTAKRAANRSKPLTKPKEAPKKVPATGTVPSFGNTPTVAAGRISEISDSEFESAGM